MARPARTIPHVSERTELLRRAYAALDAGRIPELEACFSEGAQWLGIPGSGVDGATPI